MAVDRWTLYSWLPSQHLQQGLLVHGTSNSSAVLFDCICASGKALVKDLRPVCGTIGTLSKHSPPENPFMLLSILEGLSGIIILSLARL